MADDCGCKFTFPIGYQKFHKKQVYNYQLNRPYSLGYARYEDLAEAGQKIKTFTDWGTVMRELSERAEAENRIMNAAFYYRAAEFYILTDNPEKNFLYDKFIDLFYKVFEGENIEKVLVPYSDKFLPAIKVPSKEKNKRGTIVLHGGFDSFIEEFYSLMKFFAQRGFDVIGFDGPGQGGARKKYDLPLEYKWEKPVKAVLDHFDLEDITLIGLSMGGHFCLRAAAYEPRIKRVIASGFAVDYTKMVSPIAMWLLLFFSNNFPNLTNRLSLKKVKKGGIEGWSIGNLMYITKSAKPTDAIDFILKLTAENVSPELVKQDVLLLTGRNDHFIPFKVHKMNITALPNAKSVTDKVFTKETDGENHCQVGNMGLALDVMLKWIEDKP